ncbi:TrmH family RNA methyltransferase [Nitratiruptor tergarcus]|uniref:rRNA methylases n=1 Tax=Nitratiruptor tergarcus DSM 16512 TaxID=1069081 RepID=A0A1W1WUR5_9BACT|nr:TrmH family RNA methyltransferase [Nitratiruptor tergarcus]SMC10058.1 rRNA methylases [Nitratiruptor tergarcus DSM 16512]
MKNNDYQLSKQELREIKANRENFHSLPKHPIICVLDNLSNAYNIGVIIRLCEAFKIEKLYVCNKTRNLLLSKKVKKTALGTQKWLDIEHTTDTKKIINDLRNDGYTIIAVELTKKARQYNCIPLNAKVAYVFGNENYGLSQEVINCCDMAAFIPMYGMGNSLNVSTAAGIIIADAVLRLNCI